MPEEGIDFADREDLLSYEEILRLANIFKHLGVSKVRLTGGEPFVRKDIDQLLGSLSELFPKVHVTTNATSLDVSLLQELELSGLNISLDSLDRDKFLLITRRDLYDKVMGNILACNAANIPIKINMVVMQGVNDMEINDFIAFGIAHDIEVRFIEAMPFNEGDGNKHLYLNADRILESIMGKHELHKVVSDQPSASEHFMIGDYRFGIIPAYTRALCGTCNRIRLTPQGELLNCLYSQKGVDLRSVVRTVGISDAEIEAVIRKAVSEKHVDGHAAEQEQVGDIFRSMTTIGG